MSAQIDGNKSPLQTPHAPAQPDSEASFSSLDMMMPQKDPPKAPFGSHGGSPSKYIQIKGRPGSLELVIDPDAPLINILEELRQLLLANTTLLQHASALTLNFNEREIDRLQYKEIHKIVESQNLTVAGIKLEPEALESFLEGEFGVPVQIQQVASQTRAAAPLEAPKAQRITTPMPNTGTHPSPSDILRQEAASGYLSTPQARTNPITPRLQSTPVEQAPIRRAPMSQRPQQVAQASRPPQARPPVPQPAPIPQPLAPEVPQREFHKVMRTLRAGTSMDFEGDVVIFGDLNAGAEIKATGDIIVLGSLRGIAHAGYKGDTNARIFANDLSPTQLRLAHQIAIAPATDVTRQRTRMSLEMAFLNNTKQIEVKNVDAGRIPV